MSEDVTIKMLEAYIKTFERWNDLYPITPQLIETLKSTLEIMQKQQKEIEELKKPRYVYNAETGELKALNNDFISKDKIRERIKEARKIRWHIPKLVIEYFEELLEEK